MISWKRTSALVRVTVCSSFALSSGARTERPERPPRCSPHRPSLPALPPHTAHTHINNTHDMRHHIPMNASSLHANASLNQAQSPRECKSQQTCVSARKLLGDRLHHRASKLLEHSQVLLGEGVLPHVGVHGGAHNNRLAHVPCAGYRSLRQTMQVRYLSLVEQFSRR